MRPILHSNFCTLIAMFLNLKIERSSWSTKSSLSGMVSIIGSRRQINKIQRTTYCIFTGTSDGFHTPQSN